MSLYSISIGLHLAAMALWLGHMFVWSLVIGPALKALQPAESAELLRERSMYRGGLGWPALAVLLATGLYQLAQRGVSIADLIAGSAFAGQQGCVLAVKLGVVGLMVCYQVVFAHRRAPIAIYFNMLAALIVLAASVVLVRGWVA
jgi:uncharacterized membrane protein